MRERAPLCALPALTLVLALGAAGCSMSFPLESLLPGKSEKTAEIEQGDGGTITSSISQPSERTQGKAGDMSNTDWTFATAALREALGGSQDDVSISWQNPSTGAQGTVTPISSAFVQDGFACRKFLASNMRDGHEAWFEGTACRVHRGQWDIRTTRPLQKS